MKTSRKRKQNWVQNCLDLKLKNLFKAQDMKRNFEKAFKVEDRR